MSRFEDGPLIHIGYHKTGTTWLQRQVFDDADLGFAVASPPAVVEDAFVKVNPFSYDPDEGRRRMDPFAIDAAGVGSKLVVSHERLSGAPLQGGIDAHEIADRLYATFPNGRVLVVIRDQRDMLTAVYKQITKGSMSRDSYARFLRTRVREGRWSPVIGFLRYHHLISYYQSLFGADRVLVLPYESLGDPVDFVGRICKFVELPQPAEVSRERENVSLPATGISLVRMVNIGMHTLGLDRWLLGPRSNKWLVNARFALIQQIGKVAPKKRSARIEERWREETDRLLRDELVESNVITGELAGLDLGSLGYMLPGNRTLE